MSPDSPEPENDYQLTPRTEAKYSKIDEDFQMMLQRNQLNGQRVRKKSYAYLPVNNTLLTSFPLCGYLYFYAVRGQLFNLNVFRIFFHI